MWLPIVQRELRVASRRAATFWLRLLSPGCAVLFIFSSMVSRQDIRPQIRGETIFHILASVLFVLSVLAGLRYTVDCVLEERRSGTLDLLKLTGLRGIDIVAGKLTANSLGAFFSLVAAFPILAVPLLLGGVTGSELAKMTLLLAATLLLSLAIGIFASAQAASREGAVKQAITMTAIISTVGLVGLFYLRSKKHFERRTNIYPKIEHSTDFVVLFFVFIMMVTFGLPLGAPAASLWRIAMVRTPSLYDLVAFWVSFSILLYLIYYFLKKADPFETDAEQEERWRTLSMWQVRLMRGRFTKNMDPILWLVTRGPSNSAAIIWTAIVAGLFQFTAVSSKNLGVGTGSSDWIAFLLFTVLVFLLARQCSNFFSEARENGMLEVLLVSPLSWRHLFGAQKKAFFAQATWPLGLVAAGEVAGELSILSSDPSRSFRIIGLLVPFLSVAGYFLCREAILWCSLFFAFQSKNALHCAGKVTVILVIIPVLATYILPFDMFVPLFPYADLLAVNLFYIVLYGCFAIYGRLHLQNRFEPKLVADGTNGSYRKLLSVRRLREVGKDLLVGFF